MKKIGIMFGMEQSFPQAVEETINTMKIPGIKAETIEIGAPGNNDNPNYHVIFDRVSDFVPFYKTFLKNAALNGSRVVNNPFWSCADDNFFHASLAKKIGIDFPRTVVLPTKELPAGTSSGTMNNLKYPLNWDDIFNYVGFPAFLKPNKGNGLYNVYKVYNPQEFFSAYDLTGSRVMILQQNIDFEKYFRCFVIGQKQFRIMNFDPTKPQHLRYAPNPLTLDEKLKNKIEKLSIKISSALGFDFNSVDFAIHDGKPFVIEFLNPQPNIEQEFLHDDNFNWLVKNTADYLIELAKAGKSRSRQYNWDQFLRGPKVPATGKKRGRPAKKK